MNLALATGPLAQAIGWALLHLLWQATAVAVLLAIARSMLSGRSANLRYAVSCAALALVVALGVTTALRSYPAATAVTATQHEAAVSVAPSSRHSADARAVSLVPGDRLRSFVRSANEALPAIVTAWLVGVAVFSLRLILDWLRARRLVTRGATQAREQWQVAARRLSEALGVRHAVRLLESAAVEVPSVIGLVSPAILLPASTVTGLTPAQLEMILAHELAHIRRHDFVVNLLQAGVETLLFYHPAVWWISRQVRIERENCCDDLAVQVCGNPVQYARALTRLEELRAHAPLVAMSASGSSLLARVRRIAGGSRHTSAPAVRGAAALVVLSCVLLASAPTFPAIGEIDTPIMQRTHRTPAVRSISVVPTPGALAIVQTPPSSRHSAPRVSPSDPTPADANDDADTEGDAETRHDRRISIDDLIGLRSQGVTPEVVHEARALFPGASLRDITSMSAVGVTPDFVREMRSAGLEVNSAEEAIGLAATGVTSKALREWRASGLEVTSAEEAQGLAAVGVTAEFVREMRSAGLHVDSVEEAQGLAAVGVTPEFVRETREAGLEVSTAEEAQGLAAVGVTPEYVRQMRVAGVAIADAQEAQSLRALNVTPEFVRRLAAAGYRHLSVEQLSQLGASGVTGDFIHEMSQYRSK